MKFIDQTEIMVSAGDGGPGMVSFMAAKNQPKLGPDGGNGGNGGDVVFIADRSANTLSKYRYRQTYRAEHGVKGGINNRTGRCGDDLCLEVPLGTVVYDNDTGACIGEVVHKDDRLVVAKGGKRGYGNKHFVLATRQAPGQASQGTPGEKKHLRLELKLLADVGLTGFPNAGKSTLLSVISAARPKIASYPFTTLTPNLGVVDLNGDGFGMQSFVVADIPGIIEGASEGKGLGYEFLRHIERTSVIAFVIDGFDEERTPLETYQLLCKELKNYESQVDMLSKRQMVVITKTDLAFEDLSEKVAKIKKSFVPYIKEEDLLFVSCATQTGVEALKLKFYETVTSLSHENENGSSNHGNHQEEKQQP